MKHFFMKPLAFLIFILIVWVVPISAQKIALPRFEDYSVNETFKGKVARVKLTSSSARMYRTMLRLNARKGVNFAGHYILAAWGCGSDCHSFAMIDAKTGNVYFSDLISFVGGQLYQEEERLQHQKNSRLLIVAGAKNDEEVGKFYFEWKNYRLSLIKKTELPLVKDNEN